MSAEEEIEAMTTVSVALEGLENDARARVLFWAASHYGISLTNQRSLITPRGGMSTAEGDQGRGAGEFQLFADLFNAANAQTERDKALVAAYWVQVCQNAGVFQSQALNDLLKDLGHGIGNITEALNQLKDDRPALLLQLKKSGSSKQSRKTYKLTQEGLRRVETMTQGESTN